MARTFCDLDRLELVCDTYQPRTEVRRDVEVRVLTVKLRLEPCTPAIAAAIAPQLRRHLFTRGNSPRPLLREVLWSPAAPAQELTITGAPDTDAGLVLDQVRIERVRVRLASKGNYWRLIVVLTAGPCDRDQLAYLQEWVNGTRFVTFNDAQPTLFDQVLTVEPDDDEPDDDDPDDEPAGDVDGGVFTPSSPEPARQVPRRHQRKPH